MGFKLMLVEGLRVTYVNWGGERHYLRSESVASSIFTYTTQGSGPGDYVPCSVKKGKVSPRSCLSLLGPLPSIAEKNYKREMSSEVKNRFYLVLLKEGRKENRKDELEISAQESEGFSKDKHALHLQHYLT